MLTYFVIVPLLTAVFLYVFSSAKIVRIIAIIAQAILASFATQLFFLCKKGDIITTIGNYESVLGITLRADTLSSVFVVLVTFAFFIAALYSLNEQQNKLFWLLLFIWEGLLIGIFLTRDLFNVFVLMEVAMVVVSILIMFNRDNRSMYDGMFFLMVNIVVMQFYLFGVGYVYKLTGVLDMEAAALVLSEIDKSSLILPFALIMTAVGLKCALVPLYSWLPKAHGTAGAPSAISALLSGVHIKSGVYLFMRIIPIFQNIDASWFFLWAGILTGIVGFIFAMSQSDIKLVLAYHTISQIGMIVASLSIGDSYSYMGGLYHAINHALFKAALFLSAGVIYEAYGTRNVYEIRGVFKRFPLVGMATAMAILGITGAPLFNGSISKYFIMSGTNRITSFALTFINLGTIVSFIKYSTMLYGKSDFAGEAVKISINKQLSIFILGLLCFVGGILGEEFIEFLFNVQVSVDAAGYLQKVAYFVASVVVGYFIYKYFVLKSSLLKRIKEIDLGFRAICVSIGAFFAFLLIAAKFSVG
ncbi:MAG: proton-conducting membrane transporter [Oscillospiraceae bacterium]|nr:proton-conducting membrane transporter [Oscillospiraceae bacterium]